MAVWSDVKLSSFGPRIRIDAEYYKPIYLERAQTLSQQETVELGSIAKVTDGIHASPVFQPGSGIQYISAKCVKNCVFDLTGAEEIPPHFHEQNAHSALRVGDVIISTVGTIGFCAVVDSDMLPANCDRHVGIVRVFDPHRYDPHYISAFINSIYGRNQTIREATGNVQLNLFIYSIAKLRIPFIDGYREVGNQIRNALALRKSSQELYFSAEQVLEKELGLDSVGQKYHLGYETRFSEITQTQRWDSEYYQPVYQHALDRILKAQNKRIDSFVNVDRFFTYLTNGHTPLHHDLKTGDVLFLTAEHVSDFRINFETDKRILRLQHETELAKTALRDGDILMTIKGKVGNCAVVHECPEAANINQDVALIRLRKGTDPYFFSAWFNSSIGRQLVKQRSTGGINPFLGLGNLRRLLFPIINPKEQSRIGNLVRELVIQAYTEEHQASYLIEQAEHTVEKIIERVNN